MTTKSIELINAIQTSNASVIEAKEKAVKRMSDNKMTDRAEKHIVTFLQVAAKTDFAFDSDIVLANVYAVEKAKKFMRALSMKSFSFIDDYTLAISINALKRTKNKNINNREQNASLCIALEVDTMSATMKRLHRAESTATTQSSSTRVALNAMHIAEYDSAAKELSFNDNETAKQFIEIVKTVK